MNIKNISKRKFIMTVVLVAVIIMSTVLEFFHMNATTVEDCWGMLDDVAVYANVGLRSVFFGNISALSNITTIISKNRDIMGPEVCEMVKNTSAGAMNSTLRIYYADGTILSGGGFVQRTEDMPPFEEIVSREPKIYSIHKDPLHPNNKIIEHMMPVIKDGDIVAMASVVLVPEAVEHVIPVYGFNGQSSFFLIDKKTGEIMIDTFDKLGDNIYTGIADGISPGKKYSLDTWANDVRIGKDSNFSFSLDDKKYYVHSIQTFNHDWAIAVVADSNVVFDKVYDLRFSFVVILMLEVVAFFLYLIFLMVNTRKMINYEAEQGKSVIDILASDYEVVIFADIAEDKAQTVNISKRLSKIFLSLELDSGDERPMSERLAQVSDMIIHPEDRQIFILNTCGENIKEALKEGNSLSFDFRAGLNGKFRHYTMKAVSNRNESANSVVMGFRDIEKEYRLKKDAADEKAKKREIMEEAKNYSVVAGLSGDFDYVAYIDYDTQEVKRYRINDKIKKIVSEFDDDKIPSYQRFLMTVDKLVYSEDHDRFMEMIDKETILKNLHKDKVVRLECRFVIDDKTEYFRIKFVKDENAQNGAIVGLLNINSIVESEKRQREQENVIKDTEFLRALSDQFEVVYDVDIETGAYEEITHEGVYSDLVAPLLYKDHDFFEDVKINTPVVIYKDDVEESLRKTERENIKKTLDKVPFEEWNYRIIDGDGYIWYRMRIAYRDKSKKHVIFGLFNINDRKKQEETLRLYEQDAIFYQRAILNSSFSYYKVNLTKNVVISPIIERVNGEPEDYTDKFGTPTPDYDSIIRISAAKYVHDEYKDSYVEELSGNRLIERFEAGEQMPEYTCMVWSSILGLHFRKYVNYMTKDDVTGDILTMVVAYDVTTEMQKELEQREYINQVMSLSDDFESIYDVDIDSGEYTESIKGGKFDEEILNQIARNRNYFVTQDGVINSIVYNEDKDKINEAMTKEGLLRNLAVNNSFYIDFRCVFGERISWRRIRVCKIGEWKGERRIIIGLVNNDEIMKKEKEHQEVLENALHMANSANNAKTVFLNSMSHDIRTPMNAIMGFTTLASKHIGEREKVEDYLKKISQASDHLLSLINDVLDMSRIESGKMGLREEKESLADIIHSIKSIVQPDVAEKNLALCIDVVNVKNERVICDKLRIKQILLNIVSNSVKYTYHGGKIQVTVRQKPVSPSGYATYEFRIEDNGMGMGKDYIDKIFEPFTREKSVTVSGIQGTGLGMSITKNIVDMMGGSIEVESEKNVGTVLTVNLNLKIADDDGIYEPIPEYEGENILLISDIENIQNRVIGILDYIGAKVTVCGNAGDGLNKVRESVSDNKPYSMILVDSKDADDEVYDAVREIVDIKDDKTPVMILSACEYTNVKEKLEGVKVSGFVNEPMFPSDIYEGLKNWIDNGNNKAGNENYDSVAIRKNILLVEDNELNREIACELLEEMGGNVIGADDGSEAVEMFKKYDEYNFDLVLMDIQMPVIDGYEATRQIRLMENGRFKDIPIVAMTANAFEEDRKKAIDCGMNDHISKPVDVRKLREIMNIYMN